MRRSRCSVYKSSMHTPISDVYIYTASCQMICGPSGPQRTTVTSLLSSHKLLELCTCTAAGLSVRCKTVSQRVSRVRQYCKRHRDTVGKNTASVKRTYIYVHCMLAQSHTCAWSRICRILRSFHLK